MGRPKMPLKYPGAGAGVMVLLSGPAMRADDFYDRLSNPAFAIGFFGIIFGLGWLIGWFFWLRQTNKDRSSGKPQK